MQTILVVDDELLNLKLISAYLEDYPYNIIAADSATNAWKLLHEPGYKFDLILLDRMMPDMDGIELVKKIKQEPDLSSIPIIMQSAAAEQSKIDEVLKSGVAHYITKPFDEEQLAKLVNSVLS